MRTRIRPFLPLLVLASLAAVAHAAQYPPGPGGACPDTLSIWNLQDPAAPCHPALGDSVYGVGGICTAFDTKTSGVGFYMQLSGGGPYSGIYVFTGNEVPPYARGDSVVVETGQYAVYSGDAELTSLSGSWGHVVVRYVSSGHALPPFHEGTVHEFSNSLSNHDADPWAGCLVRVSGTTMRVARTAGLGNNFLVVDNVICPPGSAGPCDSMYVDQTMLPNPSCGQPGLGTLLTSVAGVYALNTNSGPRVRQRDCGTIPTPPNLANAYSVHADTIRVVFDQAVTPASAEDVSNYTLGSGGSVLGAVLEANGSCADVAIANGLGPGDDESITVSDIVSATSLEAMPSPQARSFYNGVIPITTLRAPDLDSLIAVPCQDRSRFSGAGSGLGRTLTFRGVCVGTAAGSLSNLEDPSRAMRSAITGFGLPVTTVGHQYLIVCSLQEYYGETEAVAPVYARDEGPVTTPAPVEQTVAVLRDATCDATQAITNGKDYAGMLVRLELVKVTSHPQQPGDAFSVVNLDAPGDTIRIVNEQAWTYQPDSLDLLDITGIVRFAYGAYVVSPRSNADFLIPFIGVEPEAAKKVSFAVYPNPARVATVKFALPRQSDVELAVFDLSGRRVATLAKGPLAAGEHTRTWDGSGAGAGVYFVRLRAGAELYNIRAVNLR